LLPNYCRALSPHPTRINKKTCISAGYEWERKIVSKKSYYQRISAKKMQIFTQLPNFQALYRYGNIENTSIFGPIL
jgi:hypothetical protein